MRKRRFRETENCSQENIDYIDRHERPYLSGRGREDAAEFVKLVERWKKEREKSAPPEGAREVGASRLRLMIRVYITLEFPQRLEKVLTEIREEILEKLGGPPLSEEQFSELFVSEVREYLEEYIRWNEHGETPGSSPRAEDR